MDITRKNREDGSFFGKEREGKENEERYKRGSRESMKLDRCPKGHFYEVEKYGNKCPYCNPEMLQPEKPKPLEGEAAPVEPKRPIGGSVPIGQKRLDPAKRPVGAERPVEPKRPMAEDRKPAEQKRPVREAIPEREKPVSEKPDIAKVNISGSRKNQAIKSAPVGWLVCIDGVYKGWSFELKTGRNFIGRSTNMIWTFA